MVSFSKSEEMFKRSCLSMSGGMGSILRQTKPVPLFIEQGKGSRVFDVDGNEYIDFGMHFGPLILGHGDPDISAAVIEQMEKGYQTGYQHELEIHLSELLKEVIPCADMVQYSTTGSEAVHTALRLARAFTGKQKIIKFEGHYHGWFDCILVSCGPMIEKLENFKGNPVTQGQSLAAIEDVVVLPWNNPEKLEDAFSLYKDEIAGIIMSPLSISSGGIFPKDNYLEFVRDLTKEKNVILIFDEIITGFRVALGGIQEYFGVIPDLAVFGKALGGGFPISCVAGSSEVMNCFSSNKLQHRGTFNTTPICVAAAYAVVSKLRNNRQEIYGRMTRLGNKLMNGIRDIANNEGIDLLVEGSGPNLFTNFTSMPAIWSYDDYIQTDKEKFIRFKERLIYNGIGTSPSQWFLSAAHSEEDIEIALAKIEKSMGELKD